MSPRRHRQDYSSRLELAPDADEIVEFDLVNGSLVAYRVVLRYIDGSGNHHTVRVFDNAHAHDEHHMHRYSVSGEKEPAEIVHFGEPYEAMSAAQSRISESFEEMIAPWRR